MVCVILSWVINVGFYNVGLGNVGLRNVVCLLDSTSNQVETVLTS